MNVIVLKYYTPRRGAESIIRSVGLFPALWANVMSAKALTGEHSFVYNAQGRLCGCQFWRRMMSKRMARGLRNLFNGVFFTSFFGFFFFMRPIVHREALGM